MKFHLLGLMLMTWCGLSDPLACQPNAKFPMLPIYHIIGNVTMNNDGSIKLEHINDCSGVTYSQGIYHVWHQCCQNHWDHVISKDLVHWQRVTPPIMPLTTKTWDGSVSMLDQADGGPLILYDAQDGKKNDKAILGVARLIDPKDKYLLKWVREKNNPVVFNGAPIAFPGQVWKNGDHWNFIGQGARFQSNDSSFHTWTHMNNMIGHGEHGGQWWIPMPNQIDGKAPPAGTPNYLVNVNGGEKYLMGNYNPKNETFTPWIPSGETAPRQAVLEYGRGNWWGGQGGQGNNNRMMIIGWAPDYHGDAGPGINFLTRLTLLREVNYDAKLMNLVSNPVPELTKLRNGTVATEKNVALKPGAPHVVTKTGGGAAASSDINIVFSGITGTTATVFGACVLSNATFGGIGISITVQPAKTIAAGRMAYAKVGPCVTNSTPFGGPPIKLFNDTQVMVRILADRSVGDFFVQGGRWAGIFGWPANTPRAAADSNIVAWASTTGVSANIDVYGMGCGWVTPSYTDNPIM